MEKCPACGSHPSWVSVIRMIVKKVYSPVLKEYINYEEGYQVICTACGQVFRVDIENKYRD